MLETKIIELRDYGTCIPLLCIRMVGENEMERWLLSKVGYYKTDLVLVNWMAKDNETHYSHLSWESHTLAQAHNYIHRFWVTLKSGDMIDLRVIRGETDTPCKRDKEECFEMLKKVTKND